MVSIEDAVLAKYSHGKHHFELLVDPNLALAVRQGKSMDIKSALAVEAVFKDARKGDHVSPTLLQEVFETENVLEAAKQILAKGDLQLTTEQRKNLVEEKRRAIVANIARDAFNPQTKTPHPATRIETAMQEAHVSVDPFERVEIQVEKIIAALRPILPISIGKVKIDVIIPSTNAGAAYGQLKKHTLESEEWKSNGDLHVVLELPAGLEDAFYEEVNALTKGQAVCNRLSITTQGDN